METANANSLTTEMDAQTRHKVRNGIRMVLEDRMYQASISNDMEPVMETLNYIDCTFKNGFSVDVLIVGFTTVNGIVLTARDDVILVKEFGKPIIVLYRDRDTCQMTLGFNEMDFLAPEEKSFYDTLRAFLDAPDVQQDQYLL